MTTRPPRATRTSRPSTDSRQALTAEFHAPLEKSVGYLLRNTHRAFERALGELLGEQDILTAEWSVLRALWFEDDLSQVEIAERLRVERASLTKLLNSMEQSGLITRTENLEDRRKLRIRLTPKGRRLEEVLLPSGDAVNSAACKGFSKAEITTLRHMLMRLIANLEG